MSDGEGAETGAGEGTQSGAGTTTDNSGSGTSSDSGTQSGTTDTNQTDSDAARLKADLDAQRERTRAADQRAAKIEAELKQLRDKDLPEQQKLTRDLAEAQKAAEALKETNRELALKVAFLSDNTYSWHNPERALKLVDMSQVEIGDDGKVSGLKDALNALAKSDAYLIKTEKQDDGKQGPPGTVGGDNGSTGSGKNRTSALAARLPVMNTRVKRS